MPIQKKLSFIFADSGSNSQFINKFKNKVKNHLTKRAGGVKIRVQLVFNLLD